MSNKPYYSTQTHKFYPTLDAAIAESRSAAEQQDGEVSCFAILYRDSDGDDHQLDILRKQAN